MCFDELFNGFVREYQGKAELLVFRPLSQHGFLVQLAEKKLVSALHYRLFEEQRNRPEVTYIGLSK